MWSRDSDQGTQIIIGGRVNGPGGWTATYERADGEPERIQEAKTPEEHAENRAYREAPRTAVLETADPRTGEVQYREGVVGNEGQTFIIRPKTSRKPVWTKEEGAWFMTTGKGADEIAKARLGSAENAVFWALIGRLRPSGQNLVRASWGSLAQRTDYARANVGKALRKLERRGFIKKLPLKGRETAVYMVNPYLVFSGGADSRKSALAMWNRDALSKADLALAEDLPPLEEDVLEGEVTSARTGQEIVSR